MAMGGLAAAMALTLAFIDGVRVLRHTANASIVNGGPAEPCFWQYHVGLVDWEVSRKPFCGGSLIELDWVLTSASCLLGRESVRVVAGKFYTQTDSVDTKNRWSKKLYINPNYVASTFANDFGLIRLQTPFVFSKCIDVVSLPTTGEIPSGSNCWITGWGALSESGSYPSELQQAPVIPMSNADCKATGYANNEIKASMRCATGLFGGIVQDACNGDVGGPLSCKVDGKWRIYGVSSWGEGCARANYPGVYARVTYRLGWIQNTLNGDNPIR